MRAQLHIWYVTHYAVYVEGGKSQWWIGLEDRDLDGMYTWVDGTPVTFVDWARHQPTQVVDILYMHLRTQHAQLSAVLAFTFPFLMSYRYKEILS